MRIIYSFLIIVCSAILWLIPITDGAYDFQTDERTDTFTVITAVGADNSTVQLFRELYDDDTSTISFRSYDSDDSPLYSSYNTTTRALLITGLAENTTRAIDVTYDIEAMGATAGITGVIDRLPWIWIIVSVAFPIVGLVAVWWGRD